MPPTRPGLAGPLLWCLVALTVSLGASAAAPPLRAGPSAVAGPPGAPPADPSHPMASLAPSPAPLAPPHRPWASAAPLATGVNPYALLQSEPASLGVTDYGVDSAGNGYTYSTPIWWADANISRLLAYYPTNTNGNGGITLQLNVVLRLVSPSHVQFAYWVQDVVAVNTITREIVYEDNVWNLSAGGSIQSGTLTGNGSIGTYGSLNFYGDGPPCQGASGGYTGNCVTLAYPAIVTVRVTTGRYAGVPHVSFQYQHAGSWVTYDNVSFPFAGGYANNDFTVDGTQYTPYSLFYDAEWDYTGPGTQMVDRNSSLVMQLERWNGHNLQAPPNAYNFGSNTGEAISNVISAAELNPANGTVGASVTTGAGTLRSLYFSSDVATLNVSTPALTAGVITVGGQPHPFVAPTALLTLAPGTYNISLWDGSQFVASAQRTLAAGTTTDLYLGFQARYTVTFVEQGLPTTTPWSLTVNQTNYPNPGPSLALELTNGTYDYAVAPVPGFTAPAYQGTVTVDGTPVTIFVNFTAFLLPVTFRESGLPAGASWTVTLPTASQSESTPTITFDEPNGTYPFTVDAGLSYLPAPPNGSAVVQGHAEAVSVSFTLRPGFLAGHLSPTGASLIVGGTSEPTSQGTFNLTLLPGNYTVEVAAAGFQTAWANVTVAPAVTTPLDVTLNRTTAPPGTSGPTPTGISEGTALELVALAGVAAVAVVGVALYVRRRHGG